MPFTVIRLYKIIDNKIANIQSVEANIHVRDAYVAKLYEFVYQS
jgi:hypothetical protein